MSGVKEMMMKERKDEDGVDMDQDEIKLQKHEKENALE
jgi:hypothetical protein